MRTLNEVRDAAKDCRNIDNPGCIKLTEYRDKARVRGASHPVLFQIVPDADIMIIGAVPGSINADKRKAAYQRLVDGQFSLGHRSAQGLGEIMTRVGQIMNIDLPPNLTRLPDTKGIQDNHLEARKRLGIHVTNLVKCYAPTSWEETHTTLWQDTADACESRHLAQEVSICDPSMVILLGKKVADYFSVRESWGLEGDKLKITGWSQQADYLPFSGKDRFVTAWIHPGGRYFWMQGKNYWDLYAEQMAEFVE